MKVLCTGDLHIGRRSSRIPNHLDSDGRQFAASSAWSAVVDTALAHNVDVVAISGDIVDRENRFYEAMGPLERGLNTLGEHGIETVAVAGNHDFDVLPRLADSAEVHRFRLLGRNGQWQRETITRNGHPVLHIDGWSFPRQHVRTNPLAGYLPREADDVPVLGLLHADLDQRVSDFGPVYLADLQRQPITMWLLGHIHLPSLTPSEAGPTVLYPGSPYALDPGEHGSHGAWLVELAAAIPLEPRLIPLSPVRYIDRQLDLTTINSKEEFDQLFIAEVRAALREVTDIADPSPLACLCCRVTLTGRTSLHRGLPSLAATLQDDFELSHGQVTAVIEKIDIQTRPLVNLDHLARGQDLPGEVARLLRALEADEIPANYHDLCRQTATSLRGVHGTRTYLAVSGDQEQDLEHARRLLISEGWNLLDALLAQKETA